MGNIRNEVRNLAIDSFYINVKGYIAAFLALRESITPRETNSILRSPSEDRGSSCNVPVARCPYCKPPDADIASSAPGRPRQIAA